jgi:hypothetical protein
MSPEHALQPQPSKYDSRRAIERRPGIVKPQPIREVRSMGGLLTFTGAVEWDPAVQAFFDGRPAEFVTIARHWFGVMRDCGPDVRELFHDGCPVVCVADAPFGYVNIAKAHVSVGFFHGDALRDPQRLLEGTGKFMRHVKLTPKHTIDAAALNALIAAAYRDINARLKSGA